MVRTLVLFTLALLASACGPALAPTPVFRLVAPATPAPLASVPPPAALVLPVASPTPTPTPIPTPTPTPAHPRFPLLHTSLGHATVTVVDALTGEPANIGTPPAWGGPGMPHVSADGRWLVYMGVDRLILWDMQRHQAVTPAGLAVDDQREPDVDAFGHTLIYFTGPAYAPQLAICDVASGQERRLDLPRELLVGARTPSVSADGGRAAFVYTGRRGDANLAVIDLATGAPVTPATLNTQDDDQDPALSPDGQTLLFATNRNGSLDVFACDLATGTCREPKGVNTVSDESRPRFLDPEGQALAWVSTQTGSERAYARALEGGK